MASSLVVFRLLWPGLASVCLAFAVRDSHASNGFIRRCSKHPQSRFCALGSPASRRAVQNMLPQLKRWDARKGARNCFPHLTGGMPKHICCSRRLYGMGGHPKCWGHLPQAPWYNLCCGSLRSAATLARSLVLSDYGQVAKRYARAHKVLDEPCVPTRKHDRCGVFFIAYHKTGNQMLGRRLVKWFVKHYLPRSSKRANSTAVGWRWGQPQSVKSGFSRIAADFEWTHYYAPEMVWREGVATIPSDFVFISQIGEWVPPIARRVPGWLDRQPLPYLRGRVVHVVRSPVDIVGSSLRMNLKVTTEGLSRPLRCYGCSDAAWQFIFQFCGFRCGYLDLIHNVTDRPSMFTALSLEYARAQQNIQNMLSNMAKWSYHGSVLHVSVNQFRRNIPQAVACVARFVTSTPSDANNTFTTQPMKGLMRELKRTLKNWDVQEHVTYNKPRWKGIDFRTSLLRHRVWGASLRRAEEFVHDVVARQAELYGCPMPWPRDLE